MRHFPSTLLLSLVVLFGCASAPADFDARYDRSQPMIVYVGFVPQMVDTVVETQAILESNGILAIGQKACRPCTNNVVVLHAGDHEKITIPRWSTQCGRATVRSEITSAELGILLREYIDSFP